LEVGCGVGHFLVALEAAGFEAWGTEVSASALARLRKKGLRVLEGSLPALRLEPERFDAVVLFEVLEHVDEPIEHLREARRVLRNGGALLVTTPNFGSLSRRLLGEAWRVVDPEHVTLFTTRGLCRILERAGFDARAIWSRNLDPTELLRRWRRRAVRSAEARQAEVDACREALSRPGLAWVKAGVNTVLRRFRLGDTLEARAER
jgi:SAM-dependent methyltransferase